jgi:type IV pilus assembly protein PilA
MKKTMARKAAGFTLIELLVVIGIIAILAALVIVAINPAMQFAQARNAQRESAVATILNAVGQNIANNKGTFTCSGVSLSGSTSTIGTSGANLATCLVPTYIATGIPVDPANGTDADTKYTVSTTTGGQFIVCSPQHAETAVAGSAPYCLSR